MALFEKKIVKYVSVKLSADEYDALNKVSKIINDLEIALGPDVTEVQGEIGYTYNMAEFDTAKGVINGLISNLAFYQKN